MVKFVKGLVVVLALVAAVKFAVVVPFVILGKSVVVVKFAAALVVLELEVVVAFIVVGKFGVVF